MAIEIIKTSLFDFSACLKAYGQGYLKATLQPLIAQMLENPDTSYEVCEQNCKRVSE